jgi:alkylation response protein AidB-like acyl-CoA dehydrogenase
MDFELEPATQAGRRFAALCEKHAPDFFARAAMHDREGSFPHEDIADLIASGAIAATVPEELGGFGVASARDFAAAMSRLGRGDGSITLAMNMHYLVTWSMARGWRAARAGGAEAQEAALAGMLREVVAGKRILSVLATENGIPIMQPMATAMREGEGWRLNGRKHFATGSPAATHFAVRLRYQDEQGAWRFGGATVAKDAPGVVLLDNWDALGMRGSGSGEVAFENCFIPLAGVADAGAWGGTFIGIAELARSLSLRQIAQRKRGDVPAVRHLVAENEIDLAAARGMLARHAALVDRVLEAHPLAIPRESGGPIFADSQATKHFVMRKAIDIVDRALTLSGGSGFMQANPLSRLYRDVRAGPFMQPYSPIEGLDAIGRIALGQPL